MKRTMIMLAAAGMVGLGTASAQGPQVGVSVGPSFPGAAQSRSTLRVAGTSLGGGGSEGWFASIHVESPIVAGLAFRTELFVNRLGSDSGTQVAIGGTTSEAARVDRAVGLAGSFVASLGVVAGLTPRVAMGLGPMWTRLSGANGTGDAMGLAVLTSVGLERRTATGRVWLELRYHQALDDARGSAFMPVALGVSL